MRILIFGGTTEGRRLAEEASALGAEVTVSVATPLGAEELAGLKVAAVWVGRKTTPELVPLLAPFDLCVDATHPYAAEASVHIKSACREAGLPLRRLLRPASGAEGVVRVDNCTEAAAFLAGTQGNILLATGAGWGCRRVCSPGRRWGWWGCIVSLRCLGAARPPETYTAVW